MSAPGKYDPIAAYAQARIDYEKKFPRSSSDARIEELELVKSLCNGLSTQEQMLSQAMGLSTVGAS